MSEYRKLIRNSPARIEPAYHASVIGEVRAGTVLLVLSPDPEPDTGFFEALLGEQRGYLSSRDTVRADDQEYARQGEVHFEAQKTERGDLTGKPKETTTWGSPRALVYAGIIVIGVLFVVWLVGTVATGFNCAWSDPHANATCHQWPFAGNLNPIRSHDSHSPIDHEH